MNIQEVLEKHRKWLVGVEGGERADLQGANLYRADLRGADLCYADLCYADLRGANLRSANLCRANLRGADLQGANLCRANLRGANVDFACWPLWCGSQGVKVDIKIVYQILAHVACLDCDEPEFAEIQKDIMPYAVKSHRAKDLGLIADTEEEV